MPFKTPHPFYSTWQGMLKRCTNKKFKQWSDYGGRGITVCERWKLPIIGFHNFVSDMGERPNNFTLDRINNNGNYEPSNCRWSSRIQQQSNRSITKRFIIEGNEYLLVDLARMSGLKPDSIQARIKKGMNLSEILDPKKHHNLEGLKLGGVASGKKKKAKTHCPADHEYNEENTYFTPQGWRNCKKCHAEREAIKRLIIG